MQTSAKRKAWEAVLLGREQFNTWLKARTLKAYRSVSGKPNAIIPRKRKRIRRLARPSQG